MAQGIVVAARRYLDGAGGERGQDCPEGLVLGAELFQARRRLPQRAVEVAGDRRGPRQGQVGHRAQEGILDLLQQQAQALSRDQRRRIVTQVTGQHGRSP